MGRKKKKRRTVIFCYYCDRHFDNEKVLIEHQRGKHFKCPICHRRLSSARGMMIHVFQVHKESIDTVPHAKTGRDSFDLEIFGMVGVPQDLIREKQVKIYGEPQAKKQKLEHMGIQLPGVGVTQPMFNGGMGMPVMMQPQMHQMARPMGRGFTPMVPRGMMPMHQQNHQMMQGRGQNPMMRNMNPHMNHHPPPHQMGRGMPPHHHHQMQPRNTGGYPGMPPTGPPGQQPQRPGMGAPHMGGMHPNMMHQQGIMPPHQQQQLQQGMMMPPQQPPPQQPLSEAAKADIVPRQDALVTQGSVVKKVTKKRIVRIYDNPGFAMEEGRAIHPKYSNLPVEE